MKERISVILTSWLRPQYLEEQVESILSQTVRPREIILWYNAPPKKSWSFLNVNNLSVSKMTNT